jgi:hypothetical protein
VNVFRERRMIRPGLDEKLAVQLKDGVEPPRLNDERVAG